MNILDMMSPTRWLIALALALALVGSFFGYGQWRASQATAAEAQRWELEVQRLQAIAARTLADETAKVLRLERELATATSKLEDEHAARLQESADAGRRLAAAARNGRLRDPNAPGCGGGGGGAAGQGAAGAGGGEASGAQAGGLLSAQLTGLLQRDTRDSDEINDAYALCRGWALMVEQKLNEAGGP
jgi:hypothetical protein